MRKPSFKNQKPYVYLLFGMWILSTLVLIIESCIPGNISADHSHNFTDVLLDFVAIFRPQNVVRYVDPISIDLSYETTVLPKEGDKYILPVSSGATVKYKLSYPELKEGETEYKKLTLKRGSGEQNSQDVYQLSRDDETSPVFYIVAKEEAKDCSFQICCDKVFSKEFRFDVVPLATPKNNLLFTSTPSSLNLKVNESYPLDVRMDDGVKKDKTYPKNTNRNEFLSRYYDIEKVSHSVEDKSVCEISKFGVITGKKEGKTKVHYGPFTFDVTISGTNKAVPNNASFSFSKTDMDLGILDLNYDHSEVAYTFHFKDTELDDSFSFEIVDDKGKKENMAARVFRQGKNACYIKGLRNVSHPFFLKVFSSSNPNVEMNIPLEFATILPETMTLYINNKEVSKKVASVVHLDFVTGKKTLISCRFWKTNKYVSYSQTKVSLFTEDRAVHFDRLITNGGYVTFLSPGEWKIKVQAVLNENFWYEIQANVTKGRVQLDAQNDVFSSFIRKSFGHFLAFSFDAMFLFLFLYFFLKDRHGLISASFSLLWGFVFASITELIQYFVPGRWGEWSDIGIDTAGAASGIVFIFLFVWLIKIVRYFVSKPKEKAVDEKID